MLILVLLCVDAYEEAEKTLSPWATLLWNVLKAISSHFILSQLLSVLNLVNHDLPQECWFRRHTIFSSSEVKSGGLLHVNDTFFKKHTVTFHYTSTSQYTFRMGIPPSRDPWFSASILLLKLSPGTQSFCNRTNQKIVLTFRNTKVWLHIV